MSYEPMTEDALETIRNLALFDRDRYFVDSAPEQVQHRITLLDEVDWLHAENKALHAELKRLSCTCVHVHDGDCPSESPDSLSGS